MKLNHIECAKLSSGSCHKLKPKTKEKTTKKLKRFEPWSDTTLAHSLAANTSTNANTTAKPNSGNMKIAARAKGANISAVMILCLSKMILIFLIIYQQSLYLFPSTTKATLAANKCSNGLAKCIFVKVWPQHITKVKLCISGLP